MLNTNHASAFFLQDLLKVEAKLQERQRREREEEERQRRITAKLKEKVRLVKFMLIVSQMVNTKTNIITTNLQILNILNKYRVVGLVKVDVYASSRWMVTSAETPPGLPVPPRDGRNE